ncbi:MAG: hypothetical protein SFV54_25960 [Bryobacteraceae bacterium]|nr:hypothetical protein [Bryobacteraceae bacterium]
MSLTIIDRTAETAGITHNLSGIQILTRASDTTRELSRINAIVLHQMNFSRGGDVTLYDTVIAHYAVLTDGSVLQLRPLTDILNDAHSGPGVEIEFASPVGGYPSVQRIRRGAAERPHHVQIEAGRKLVEHIRGLFPSNLRFIYSHQQFNPTVKGNCPGPHLWYNIGEWAKLKFALRSEGVSNSIPAAWTDSSLAC